MQLFGFSSKNSPDKKSPDTQRAERRERSEFGLRLSRSSSFYPPPEAGFVSDCDDDEKETELTDETATDTASVPQGKDVVWHALIKPDDFKDSRHCLSSGKIKPMRPMPMLKVSELLSGLEKTNDKWIFRKPLNDWPALNGFELHSLTCKETKLGIPSIKRIWNATDKNELPTKDEFPKHNTRATFIAPAWTRIGWAPNSPGFVFWYLEKQCGGSKKVLCGEKMLESLKTGPYASAQATMVHSFLHRYTVKQETLRDKQTWHGVVLIEWTHQLFTTLLETAWLNGCAGYRGKSNWIEDKLADTTALYATMPESMKMPFDQKQSEIRLIEMLAKNKTEFEGYLEKYSEKGKLPHEQQRFLEPKCHMSAKVRLRSCTPVELAGFVLNYGYRVSEYHELSQNCQTFQADLYAFLTGSKNVQPYGNIVKPGYNQRSKAFLYAPISDE